MSDTKEPWWKANQGIVGLAPPPWDFTDPLSFAWPAEGYDGKINDFARDGDLLLGDRVADVFGRSGFTKAQWLELADEMIARWRVWRSQIKNIQEV